MNANKALYWIALAAVSFGFSSEYQRGGLTYLHSLANCAEARLGRMTVHAQQALVAMGVLTGQFRGSSVQPAMVAQADQLARVVALQQADLDRAMAERDAALARAEARVARVQAVLQRSALRRVQVLESSDLRIMDRANRRVITICPQSGRHIRVEAVPDMSDIQVDVPNIEVGDQF